MYAVFRLILTKILWASIIFLILFINVFGLKNKQKNSPVVQSQ